MSFNISEIILDEEINYVLYMIPRDFEYEMLYGNRLR